MTSEKCNRGIRKLWYYISRLNYARTERLCSRLIRRSESIIPENAEECTLIEMDPEDSRRRGASHHHGNAYEEDEGPGASRVQCATH